jgi:hypothetical protein
LIKVRKGIFEKDIRKFRLMSSYIKRVCRKSIKKKGESNEVSRVRQFGDGMAPAVDRSKRAAAVEHPAD